MMEQHEPTSEPTAARRRAARAIAERLGQMARVAGTFVAAHRSASITAGAAAAVILLGSTALWFWVVSQRPRLDEGVNLNTALAMVERREFNQARTVIERLRAARAITPQQWGWFSYIQGAIAANEAQFRPPKDRVRRYRLAARYLEDARDRGFSREHSAEGHYLLGKCLYESGQWDECRPPLNVALSRSALRRTEIDQLLASAWLRSARPDLQAALRHATRYLLDPSLSPLDRDRGRLLQAEIQFRSGHVETCRRSLEKIAPDSRLRSEVFVLLARAQMEEAAQAHSRARAQNDAAPADDAAARYRAAIDLLRQAQEADTLENQTMPRAMYLIGLCRIALGEHEAARVLFQQLTDRFPDTHEALAGTLQSADLSRRAGHDEDAIAAYARVLAAASERARFTNPWISLDELKTRLRAAYDEFLTTERFDRAAELADGLFPMFAKTDVVEMQAQALRDWGLALLAKTAAPSAAQPRALEQAGRAHLRAAALAYRRLGNLRFATRSYPDDLWQAAACALDGHDYRRAVRVFREYLTLEARRRRPQALVGLAQALLSLGRVDEALRELNSCVERFPNGVVSYQARLLGATAYVEQGRYADAEALLRGNLKSDFLAPSSQEWRASLFAMGRLLHKLGRFEEAAQRLLEATERYPDDPQALEAAYLAADASRSAAAGLQARLDAVETNRPRATETARIRALRQQAQAGYDAVRATLLGRERQRELSPHEDALLRNSWFAQAALLFELHEHARGVEAYAELTNRYADSPLVLEAYVQIANGYRTLGKMLEARGTVEQAKVVLKGIGTSESFTQTTNDSRAEWEQRLEALGKL